jgi:hypothetical protein
MSSRLRYACLIVVAALLAGCSEESPRSASTPRSTPPPAGTPAPAAAVPQPAPRPPAVDAASNDVDVPPAITDADIPPLPLTPFPAARPMEVVRAVYTFAAKHPEVLSKMPCFCGCENRGHRHNDDCFVAARDARGRPVAWEPHGVG